MPRRSPAVAARLLVGFVVAVIGLLPLAGASADPVTDPVLDALGQVDLTPEEMVAGFDGARLPGLQPPSDPPAITGDADLDARIHSIGEARGYVRRQEATGDLTWADGFRLQPQAAAAWESLQAAAAAAGHSISLTSGWRSTTSQRSIFLGRMTGTSDAELDALLATVAMPGYSKHHTGYAIDIRSGAAILDAFRATPAYDWLAADNFANAIAHGWLPSYPDGVPDLGPNPEPWEFVWVGASNIICADFTATPDAPFCDTVGSSFASDIVWLADRELTTGCDAIRFCTDELVTRGEAATFLWRLFGRISPTVPSTSPDFADAIGFGDVPDDAFFADPVAWMVEGDITTGTSPTTFDPYAHLTRAQFVTFLWRAAGEPVPAAPLDFADVDPTSFAADAVAWAADVGITRGTSPDEFSPNATATRGQVAAFLHRFDLLTTPVVAGLGPG